MILCSYDFRGKQVASGRSKVRHAMSFRILDATIIRRSPVLDNLRRIARPRSTGCSHEKAVDQSRRVSRLYINKGLTALVTRR